MQPPRSVTLTGGRRILRRAGASQARRHGADTARGMRTPAGFAQHATRQHSGAPQPRGQATQGHLRAIGQPRRRGQVARRPPAARRRRGSGPRTPRWSLAARTTERSQGRRHPQGRGLEPAALHGRGRRLRWPRGPARGAPLEERRIAAMTRPEARRGTRATRGPVPVPARHHRLPDRAARGGAELGHHPMPR